jgi:hypothetical protein
MTARLRRIRLSEAGQDADARIQVLARPESNICFLEESNSDKRCPLP